MDITDIDNPIAVHLMNDLYIKEWNWFHNFFCPSVKLIEKKLVAAKTIKKYDTPKTSYQRVLQSPYVSASVKRSLKEQFGTLNPFNLRKIIENKLKTIYSHRHPRRYKKLVLPFGNIL